jgi:hypothetical protein
MAPLESGPCGSYWRFRLRDVVMSSSTTRLVFLEAMKLAGLKEQRPLLE